MDIERKISASKRAAIQLLGAGLDSDAADKLKTKINNLCGKTGQYSVPDELFQKRTARKNRVLISWETVKKNQLNLDQLDRFEGGVVVEFVNLDFFTPQANDPVFDALRNRLGSDLNVSSMISVRSAGGTSDSIAPRAAFELLKEQFPDWESQLIRRKPGSHGDINKGNEKIEGFVYVKIAGGQQDSFVAHKGNELIFNPACEYASSAVSKEIDLVMLFFALHSFSKSDLENPELRQNVRNEIEVIASILRNCVYESGNLLDYCQNHPSLRMGQGTLYDPIQVERIFAKDFAIADTRSLEHLNLTHNEPVENERFIFDSKRNEILSPARPTNVFWSKHLSNMMQQHLTLQEYFDFQDEIVSRRRQLLDKAESV